MCSLGEGSIMCYKLLFGLKVFFIAWVIFVPIVITARLEKIIKLLEEKNKK